MLVYPPPHTIELGYLAPAMGHKYLSFSYSGTATVEQALYNVPVGKKAMILSWSVKNLDTAATNAVRLTIAATQSTAANSTTGNVWTNTLGAGAAVHPATGGATMIASQQLRFLQSNAAGAQIVVDILEMDIADPRVLWQAHGVSTTVVTLYTCPANRVARVPSQGLVGGVWNGGASSLSGIFRVTRTNPYAMNSIVYTATVGTSVLGNNTNHNESLILGPGDVLGFVASSASLSTWGMLIESPY